MNKIKLKIEGTVYSPFSGLPAESEDGPNESDDSLVLIYYGDASDYGYVSPRITSECGEAITELDPSELIEKLNLENVVSFEVDANWNGVNTYVFAPN